MTLAELCGSETKLCRKFVHQGGRLVIIDPGHCSLSWVQIASGLIFSPGPCDDFTCSVNMTLAI